VAAYDWDELRALTLARQFPDVAGDDAGAVAETVRRIGPIQSQTARSPYVALGARLQGVTHAAVTTAYESGTIARGSVIRGTVHTCAAEHHPLLDAVTRETQRAVWTRHLGLAELEVRALWEATEEFARDTWRTPAELDDHVAAWLRAHGHVVPRQLDQGLRRYLGFGHGGLVRRPLKGAWSGQGAPGYRTAAALLPAHETAGDPPLEAARLHLRAYGPATRRDIAWWSGLGLRRVDALLEQLDPTWADGPGGAAYADVPGVPPPRDLPGVRLLPEFDAVLCGYEPRARDRFVAPADQAPLWQPANRFMVAPMLVDGRVGGHWRLEGTGRTRELVVTSFAGARKPRRTEFETPVVALSAALDLAIGRVAVARG
jgi:hypothetical protein